ncbi:MAG: hypothetical protein ACLGPL_05230 [Acidobacteriota bacterium]
MPRRDIEVYQTAEDFLNRFRQPRDGLAIAVLLCGRGEELARLTAKAHLLSDIRIILLLLDGSGIELGEGLPLYPRFTTHVSNGLELVDVAAVLKRMLNGSNGKSH